MQRRISPCWNVIGDLPRATWLRHALADICGAQARELNWLDEGASIGAGVGADVLHDFTAIDRFIRIDDVSEPNWGNHKNTASSNSRSIRAHHALLDTYSGLAKWK